MSKTPTSALHLQMGQEVLYLLLVTSLICNLLLVGLVMRAHAREPSAREPSPDEMAATITRLEGEKAGLLLQVRQLNDTLEDAKRERANLDASVEQAQSARVQLEGWVKELEGKLKIQKTPLEDQPPIIMLRDTEGYSFDPGSADIKPEFLSRLANEIVPKLIALGEKYSAQIVEVIGHTDGTAITDRLRVKANIDEFLGQALDNSSTIQVVPYDNAGLGLLRAVSVARALRQGGLPGKFDIQPLSAAYLIAPDDHTSPAALKRNDRARRRIEIRIRRVGAN